MQKSACRGYQKEFYLYDEGNNHTELLPMSLMPCSALSSLDESTFSSSSAMLRSDAVAAPDADLHEYSEPDIQWSIKFFCFLLS